MTMSDLLPPPSGPAPDTAAPHATLICTDGRVLPLSAQPGGAVALKLGVAQVAVFDAFQAVALRAAIAALPEG
jgi:hypothetical protein